MIIVHGLNSLCLPCRLYGTDRRIASACWPMLLFGINWADSVSTPYLHTRNTSPAAFGDNIDSAGLPCHQLGPYIGPVWGSGSSHASGCGPPLGASSHIYHAQVWRAWKEGVWASSLAFDIHAFAVTSGGPGTLFAGWLRDLEGFTDIRCKAITIPRQTYCTTNHVGTITVHDDSTFTLG